MPSLNYKAQFAIMVELLEKRCTIRAKRKRPIKPGDMLYHFTGMRTAHCRKLGSSICKSVTPIRITRDKRSGCRYVRLDGELLTQDEVNQLAIMDGFPHAHSFLNFFSETHSLPFVGDLYTW